MPLHYAKPECRIHATWSGLVKRRQGQGQGLMASSQLGWSLGSRSGFYGTSQLVEVLSNPGPNPNPDHHEHIPVAVDASDQKHNQTHGCTEFSTDLYLGVLATPSAPSKRKINLHTHARVVYSLHCANV